MSDSFINLSDGRKLGFIDYGKPEGLPVFMLHGTPGSRVFGFEGELLVHKEKLRIITPERPGYGLSDPSITRTIKSFSIDIEQLANHLGLTKFHVAGVSGGGPYALACGQCLSDRVISITLISSARPTDMKDFYKGMSFGNKLAFRISKYMPFLLKPLYSYMARVFRKKPEEAIEAIQAQLCPWDQKVMSDLKLKDGMKVFIAHIYEAYRQGSDGAYSDTVLLSKPWGIDFKSITAPIFMWHGEADTLMPITPVKNFSRMLPECEVHFIKEAGHLLLESEEIAIEILGKIKQKHRENNKISEYLIRDI